MAMESLSTSGSPTAESLLMETGRRLASGVLEMSHPGDDASHAWFRDGRIYAMSVPGYRPALGIRLLSGGLISPEQLSAAVAEQRERYPTHLIGQILVTMGFVTNDVIEAFVLEQVLDQVADLLDLTVREAMFHEGRRVQQDVITPADVAELLGVARQRRAHRSDILATVGGPGTVPILSPPGTGPTQTPLGPYDWALLCRVDGKRDITELARICGFTVQEAAQIVADLTLTGLLSIPPRAETLPEEHLAPVVALHPHTPSQPAAPQWQFEGTDVGEPEPMGSLLAEFSAFLHDEGGADAAAATSIPSTTPGFAPEPAAQGYDQDVYAAAQRAAEVLGDEFAGFVDDPPVPEVVLTDTFASEDYDAEVHELEELAGQMAHLPAEGAVGLAPDVAEADVTQAHVTEAYVTGADVTGADVTVFAEPLPDAPVALEPEQPRVPVDPPASAAPVEPTQAPGAPELADAVPAWSEPEPPVEPEVVAVAPVAEPAPQPPAPSQLAADPATQAPAGSGVRDEDAGATTVPGSDYADTSVFMRELSSLSDDTDPDAPAVTRRVVPITETPRKRRFWER